MTLVREKIVESDFDQETYDKFATNCSNFLGYTLLKELEESERGDRKIAKVLKELNIEPLSNESVEHYKKNEINKKEPRWLGWLALAELVGGVILGIYMGLVGLLMIAVVPVLIMTTVAVADLIYGFNGWGWNAVPLRDTRQRIPEFALQTALDVKKKLEEHNVQATFYVDFLEKNRVKYDPFLFLYANGRRWYLEYWNEPNFKAKKEV